MGVRPNPEKRLFCFLFPISEGDKKKNDRKKNVRKNKKYDYYYQPSARAIFTCTRASYAARDTTDDDNDDDNNNRYTPIDNIIIICNNV